MRERERERERIWGREREYEGERESMGERERIWEREREYEGEREKCLSEWGVIIWSPILLAVRLIVLWTHGVCSGYYEKTTNPCPIY